MSLSRDAALTANSMATIFSYFPERGVLVWNIGRRKGLDAGSQNDRGYLVICVNNRRYKAHHLIWLRHYGEWPSQAIDHINGNKLDNRVENLRLATHQQNMWNRRAKGGRPLKGITRVGNKWAAQIRVNGTTLHLGYFSTPEAAHNAYVAKARETFGEYARAS